ncbi:MAG TPA: histidine kinase [Chitinophagaceae bacterium]|nr:histidine kinase [Chitinophagaceae bacterium]
MTKHDFIFSDQRRHRLARHIAFWLIWWLAFTILFWFPTYTFKGWGPLNPNNKTLSELGLPLFIIRTLIFYSLSSIVPQIALTYVLIYWLLPNYYFKRKNPFLVGGITISVLLIFYFVAAGFKYCSVISNHIFGSHNPAQLDWSFKLNLKPAILQQISSLPIVLGFALMIKLVKRWWLKQKETELLAKEKTKAELQLLKAQVHPHFLFNTLNNIYFFTLTNSTQAPVMIKKLSGMLHYILNECDQPLVPLEKEIKMIRDYMDLEKIRYAEQMQMTIDIEDDHDNKMIAPLLLIPFVENSFKHGASKMITQPWVKLYIYIENNRLHFTIRNSKPLTNEPAISRGNIGLKNVRKRLELLYPGTHELNIVSEPGSYAVYLIVHLQDIKEHKTIKDEIKPLNEYAMA